LNGSMFEAVDTSSLMFDANSGQVSSAASASATARFIKTDTTTQGNWKGVYGADGYNLAGDLSANPSYVAMTPVGQLNYTWAASSGDGRALQKASVTGDRIAATWYGSQFLIDVNITDSAAHQLAAYFVDWDSQGRGQRIEVLDASSLTVLDTRDLSNFTGG